MQRGNNLEPLVRMILNSTLGCGYNYEPVVGQSETYEFMIASFDGIDESTNHIIEIKCPNDEIFNAFHAHGKVPEYWYWQVQHQMSVSGNETVRIYAYNGLLLSHQDIKRDDAAIKDLITKEKAFYKCMVDGVPPEDPLPEWDDPETVSIMDQRIEAEENIKRWKERSDELKELLIERAGGTEFRCRGFRVTKCVRQGNVDYKAIPELKGMVLDNYRKPPTEYWSIS